MSAMKGILYSVIPVALATFCAAGSAGTHAQGEPYRASVDSDGVQRVQMVGGDYFFKPNHIIVKANVPVELTVQLEPGVVPHSLVLEAPEVGLSVNEDLGREARKFTFTAKTAGKYPFYCRNRLLFFKSHRDRGMEGTLEVVE